VGVFSEHSVYATNYDQSVSYLLFYRVGLSELSQPVQITAQCCSTVSYDSLDNV